MAIMKIEYHSEALDMSRQVTVLYPDRNRVENPDDNDIPVLYLLHGMGGNQDSWLNRSTIERLVRYTNLIVVMVNTDKAWYTNTTYGMNYYDAIAIELPQILKRFFPNMSDKRRRISLLVCLWGIWDFQDCHDDQSLFTRSFAFRRIVF